MPDILLPTLAAFVIGLLLAASAVYLWLKHAAAENERERQHAFADKEQAWREARDGLAQRLAHSEAAAQRVPALEQQLEQVRNDLGTRRETVARLEQEVEAARQRHAETDKLLTDTREAMTKDFQLLANKLLEEKGAMLDKRQKESLAALLNPFSENLKEFKSKVEQSREDDLKARAGLIEQIRHLTELNQTIGAKAESLTNALRGESKTRGIWGEQVLQKLLELAGMREGINFRTQAGHQAEGTGERLIPDVVLDLPGGRAIVIDSKVSLVAYERYGTAKDDETARAQALKEHCASLKRHIKELSDKNYPRLYGLNSVDFTLLFVPIESALMVASEADPDLAQYALERHIALVSPNTLFTVLRTVEYIWRVEKTTRNMDRIVKRGELMYDAARKFGEHIVAINDTLDKAKASAQQAERALTDPSRGLVRQAEKLRGLGVKPKKSMPKKLAADDDEVSETGEP